MTHGPEYLRPYASQRLIKRAERFAALVNGLLFDFVLEGKAIGDVHSDSMKLHLRNVDSGQLYDIDASWDKRPLVIGGSRLLGANVYMPRSDGGRSFTSFFMYMNKATEHIVSRDGESHCVAMDNQGSLRYLHLTCKDVLVSPSVHQPYTSSLSVGERFDVLSDELEKANLEAFDPAKVSWSHGHRPPT